MLCNTGGKAALYLLFLVSAAAAFKCGCDDATNCNAPEVDLGTLEEVFVFSNGSTDVHLWQWNTITTVVVPSSFDVLNPDHFNTMCVTHKNGRKFSFTVDMTLRGSLDASSADAQTWIKKVTDLHGQWHADLVTVDLIGYFLNDDTSSTEDHQALAKVLKQVKDELDEVRDTSAKMACIVPWTPPCAEDSNSCDFAYLSGDICDFFVLNLDSFIDTNDKMCIARPTIPFTKLVYGISEYAFHHVPRGKIILGIPWHGYEYSCTSIVNDVCKLKKSDMTQKCDYYKQRKAVPISELAHLHGLNYDVHSQEDPFYSPQYTYTTGQVQHQVWYEDHYSLTSKYKLVKELGLKGIAVMFGDDLSPRLTAQNLINQALVWNWVKHEFFLKTSKHEMTDFHYADVTAGVAVGCLLLGTFLGFAFTWIGLRSRIRRPKRSFLRHHDVGLTEEFHDDDDNDPNDRHL